MAFALNPGEPLAEAIKRLLKEESDFVIEKLGSEQKKHKAIHESRKSHKKIRAILRMIRPVFGENRFKAENTFYRDNARLLSEIRDATALIEALEELKQTSPQGISAALFKQLFQFLEAHRSQRSTKAIDQDEVMTQARENIRNQQNQIPDLPLQGNKFKLIRGGLIQIYSRGYLGARQTYRNPCMENVHDWRKRVKYLWYALSILAPIWPALMTPLATELKVLSDHLGMWRDLGLLEDFVREAALTETQKAQVLAQTQIQRQRLLDLGFSLAFRIYREKPLDFVFRLEGYWTEWQALSQ